MPQREKEMEKQSDEGVNEFIIDSPQHRCKLNIVRQPSFELMTQDLESINTGIKPNMEKKWLLPEP